MLLNQAVVQAHQISRVITTLVVYLMIYSSNLSNHCAHCLRMKFVKLVETSDYPKKLLVANRSQDQDLEFVSLAPSLPSVWTYCVKPTSLPAKNSQRLDLITVYGSVLLFYLL